MIQQSVHYEDGFCNKPRWRLKVFSGVKLMGQGYRKVAEVYYLRVD